MQGQQSLFNTAAVAPRRRRREPDRGHRRLAALVVAVLLVPQLAQGEAAKTQQEAFRVKSASALADKAAQALEAGDADKAAGLYYEAYRMAPSMASALYNCARAFQIAGKLEEALKRFEEYCALPGIDPAMVKRAQAHAQEIAVRLRDLRIDEVKTACSKSPLEGNIRARRLVQLYPKDRAVLIVHGDCALAAGQRLEARNAFQVAAEGEEGESPDAQLARAKLAGLDGGAVTPARQPHGESARDGLDGAIAGTAESDTTLAWLTCGLGAALAVGGGMLGLKALADEDELHAKITKGQSGAVIEGSRASAEAKAQDIADQQTAGAVLLGAGLAVSVTGAVWAILSAPKVAAAPAVANWSVAPGVAPGGGWALFADWRF